MGAHLRGDKSAISRDLDKMYSLFPILGERRRQLAGSMSGGEQQMCAMARALMAEPRLLMIDEMSLGLAPIVVQQLVAALDTIRGEGVAILLVEQDVYLALDSADRGYVIEMGAVVHSGQAKALIDDSAVRQAYLGL
jgi:branched-chain amino acid transport system ATP-binding protein